MNNKEMKLELDRLIAENAALKKAGVKRLSMKVSPKGGVSVYGLGRWPVTLYGTQWVRLLDVSDEIRQFLTDHASSLTTKDSPAPVATTKPSDEDDLTPAQYRELVKSLQSDAAIDETSAL